MTSHTRPRWRPNLTTGTRIGTLTLAIALALPITPIADAGVPGSTPITISGGGWGHAIGMPQYAARGMAEDGWSGPDIIDYFYTGTSQTDLATTNGSAIPERIRVGTTTVAGQTRPFRWLDFSAVGGPVEVCREGEVSGGCSFTAQPGETWRVSWNSSPAGCTISRNGSVVSGAGACNVHLEWDDQPATRVSVPEVGRVFARGSIVFAGPVTYNSSTGFHFVVEVSMDEYLYGLAEMPASWPTAALQAQAIAARTFAAETTRRRLVYYSANGGLRPDCSCNLVWSTSDQAYRGWHTLSEGDPTYGADWRAAVDATASRVVVHPSGSGQLAETYYSSSTGGATENVWDVWGSSPTKYAYLASVPDPWSGRYAAQSATIRWTTTRTAQSIATALGYDSLQSLRVVARYESASPSVIEAVGIVAGNPTTRTYSGGQLKTALGLTSHHVYTISGFNTPERVAGPDRYATAAAISATTHAAGADTVYVAVGTNHPDAIAAGPAAAAESAPILLTDPSSLPGSTRSELQRLDPQTIVILGGPNAISEAVAGEIAVSLPAASVERRFGPTRYETATEISRAVFAPGVDTVWIATGQDFPDALLVTPVAIRDGDPLLLVAPDGVPEAVRAELIRLAPNRIVVVGGTSAVPDSVAVQLEGYAPEVVRIAAADRYELSALLARTMFPDHTTAYVAVGDRFPDALAAGPFTAGNGPILLVRMNSIPDVIATELGRVGRLRLVTLGGPAAVSEVVQELLATYL